MHPHTRRKTKQRLGRLTPRGGQSAASGSGAVERAPFLAQDEEKARLVESLAYFHAEQYREVQPGDMRNEDVQRAEVEIAVLLEAKESK